MATETAATNMISTEVFLKSWQAHRRLTRKIIEAFPDDKLFTFSVGGMRPFSELAMEMIGMTMPTVEGVATGQWSKFEHNKIGSKSELLALWDQQTPLLDKKFPTIPPARLTQIDKVFGQWEMPCYVILQYAVDNEIHHRGQSYVYLRALGIEPPAFYDRD